jgi:quercetin dioxygenase-like cupin family protein
MKIHKLFDFKGGWFIGDFDPSVLKTKGFEMAIKYHPKGERWDIHYHKIATEYNVLISGRMSIDGKELVAGDIFIIEPDEVADPEFFEDCCVAVIKIPSVANDKWVIK